jgi:plastocyanin
VIGRYDRFVLAGRRLRQMAAVIAFASAGAACSSDGDPSGAPSGAARTIEVAATEYAFSGDPGTIVAGDTIEFALQNAGRLDHSLEVLSAQSRSLGRTERIGPEESATVTVTFDEAGTYRLICDVDDHLSRGQVASIIVQPG